MKPALHMMASPRSRVALPSGPGRGASEPRPPTPPRNSGSRPRPRGNTPRSTRSTSGPRVPGARFGQGLRLRHEGGRVPDRPDARRPSRRPRGHDQEQGPVRGDGRLGADDRHPRAQRPDARRVLEPASPGARCNKRPPRRQLRRGEPAQLPGRPVFDREHPRPRVRPRHPRDGPEQRRPDVRQPAQGGLRVRAGQGALEGEVRRHQPPRILGRGGPVVLRHQPRERPRPQPRQHPRGTRGVRPGLFRLVDDAFRKSPWQYVRPDRRDARDKGHLDGYDPAKAPKFAWEPELEREFRKIQAERDARRRPAMRRSSTSGSFSKPRRSGTTATGTGTRRNIPFFELPRRRHQHHVLLSLGAARPST